MFSMAQSPSQDINDTEYAQQWISFLHRRNIILNVIWPVLLFVALGASLGAIYFKQQHEITLQKLHNAEDKIAYDQIEYNYLQSDFETIRSINDELRQEVKVLTEQQVEYSTQTDSQQDLTNKIVTNLKEQIDAITSKKIQLMEFVEETKLVLEQERRSSAAEITQNITVFDKQKAQLEKQISSRKVAYKALADRQNETLSEIDRLIGEISKKERQVELIEASNNKLKDNLASSNQEYGYLKTKYQNLEKKMNLMMTPIASSSKAGQPRTLEARQFQQDGLDEIIAPVNGKKSSISNSSKTSTETTFDYDKITVN